ncbi:MAG: A24 family peptidase [Leptothrix ochracea]|uniref:prepilin peptidase n=1 Tax=Leptothrix ochracea TaxID=735331 RepID=UPI0034E1FA2E
MAEFPLFWLLHPAGLALLGLMIGSFLNVVIHRLPIMLQRSWWADVQAQLADTESCQSIFGTQAPTRPSDLAAQALDKALQTLPPLDLAVPGSRCPRCGHVLAWWENIPVLSWLILRGRCKSCAAPISMRYPGVEIATAVLFAAIGGRFGTESVTLLWCLVGAVLLAAALIDWDTTLLPDGLTQPLLWLGLIAAAMGWTLPLNTAVWGAVAGYLSLWSVTWLFKLATGKVGMGEGDFKLLAALGAWTGASMILPIVLTASLVGAVVGLGMKATGQLRQGVYVPFGPFLAGGGLVVILAGPQRVMGWMGWA